MGNWQVGRFSGFLGLGEGRMVGTHKKGKSGRWRRDLMEGKEKMDLPQHQPSRE